MNKRDRIITLCMVSVCAVVSLTALPETTTHIAAVNTAIQVDHFADIALEARAAYVLDTTSGKVLYSNNAAMPMPLASLTKIMTALTAHDIAPESTIVTISAEDLSPEGDSGLYVDEKWNVTDLAQFMLVGSSNDAAHAIASSLGGEEAFVQAMNDKAVKLGLLSMRFNNTSGLDIEDAMAGGYGSAQDVARLFAYAVKDRFSLVEPTRYPEFTATSLDNIRHHTYNTDVIAEKIPGLMAGKTGFTNLAGGNLAVVFDAGIQHPIAVVVLGSTINGRFDDVQKLIDASIKTIVSGQ